MSSRLNKLQAWPGAFMVIVVAFAVLAMGSQTASAQSIKNLSPPSVPVPQFTEGQTVPFGGTVVGVDKADIISVKIFAFANDGSTPIAGLNGSSLTYLGPDGGGSRYMTNYFIPFDWRETYGHQNLKWYLEVTYNGGSFTDPGSGWHVVHIRDKEEDDDHKGKLKVVTILDGRGNLPAGSGWDLTTVPNGYNGRSGKDTSGLRSPDTETINPAPDGFYEVTGRPVSGYSISYNPQNGTLNTSSSAPSATFSRGDDSNCLTLKVIYKPFKGKLKVITVLSGGGTLPNGSGWDLTTVPNGYSGPSGKNTSGLSSPDTETVDPAAPGFYEVTGRLVGGYSISYDPRNGTLGGTPAPMPSTGSYGGGETLTLKVIYTRDTGKLKVITELAGGGTLPSGSGWDLTTKPGDFSGTDNKNTSGLSSPDTETINPAVTGGYAVTGRAVGGYSISYNPQSGTLNKGNTLTLKIIYTRDNTGKLNVITELDGGGNLPSGSGWDLTTTPGGFTGTPAGKNTSGLASGDDQSVSPAIEGDYTVTGRAVSGYSISYNPQSGTLTAGGSLTLKVIYTRDLGEALNVITEVTGGGNIPNGGGWNLTTKPSDFGGSPSTKTYDGSVASGDSVGISPAVTGDYGVTGKGVSGYSISYGPQSGTLSKNGTLTLKVIYTRDTGTLNVVTEVTGGGNIPNGGGWDLTTKPGDFGGSPSNKTYDGSVASGDSVGISPAVTGDYGVTGKGVSGYSISYGPQSGTLSKGSTLTLKVIYTRSEGEALNVITELTGGGTLPAGSGWDLTSTPGGFSGTPAGKDTSGLASGDSQFISPVVTGDYEVTGRAVSGYTISYSPQSGTLSGGGSLTLQVIYSIIPVNNHVVNAIYWDPVGGVQVPGGTITPSGNVSVPDGGSQNFTATTLPSGYVLTGGSAFTGSGSSSMAGNVGTVSNVTSDGTLRIYVELSQTGPGELEVIILPEEVRGQGARWHFKNSSSLRRSSPDPEGKETLDPGFYDLDFTDVPNWITPPPRNGVEIFSGQKTTVTVIYGQEVTGALQVFITDNVDERVRKLGAKWQPIYPASFGIPNDPNKWYNHGDIITGLPVGEVGLKFKTLNGWILPELTGASIVANTTTKETGRYWRVLIIHKSDYNGDGTDDLAVFNKNKRQWEVASISKPAGAPAAFTLFEKKFGRSDDIPTSGDYDGDGIADLAYWRETTGEWRVYKQFVLKNFGEEHDIPVPGDYNGDGITDPALFRPSTGEWFIYDRDLEEIITVNFGGAGYVPVPGNYDGDEAGMTDLGIFHIESQQWRVAFWSEKKQQWIEKKKIRVGGRKIKLRDNFGSIGNVPVQADYDGDGATDLAIYKRRPSEWDVRDQFELQLGEHLDIPVPNDWAGLGRVIPTIFHGQNGRWISVDDLLNTKFGRGGLPLMSGR